MRTGYRQIAEASYSLFRQRGGGPETLFACWQEATRSVLGAKSDSAEGRADGAVIPGDAVAAGGTT